MRHGFGRARGRRAARRCLRLEMCMETAAVHAYFARHVPKPTRRGCGSAKLYPPEKALHERPVTAIVRTASRHGPRVAVADQCDQTASPDRLRPSRYSFFVAVCMVSLSEKSQHCVSVCVEYMQCMLAKWLILSLALSFGNSLDRSRICADRIARFRFSSCVRASVRLRAPTIQYILYSHTRL